MAAALGSYFWGCASQKPPAGLGFTNCFILDAWLQVLPESRRVVKVNVGKHLRLLDFSGESKSRHLEPLITKDGVFTIAWLLIWAVGYAMKSRRRKSRTYP